MRLKSLHIEGFRCFQNTDIHFDPKVTILVGENGTGKSTVATVLYKLVQLAGGAQLEQRDYPYLMPGALTIEVKGELSPNEVNQQFISRLLPTIANDNVAFLRDVLLQSGNEFVWRWQITRPPGELRWGRYYFYSQRPEMMGRQRAYESGGPVDWASFVQQVQQGAIANNLIAPQLEQGRFDVGYVVSNTFAAFFVEHLKMQPEFRYPSTTGATGAVEPAAGQEVASVLLNLKVHSDLSQARRHDEIVQKFHQLFPRFHIRVVAAQPGSSNPEIQFWEDDKSEPLPLSTVSAGVHQSLTMLTNLLGREGQIIFLEHPETHLHPHATRFFQSLIRDASDNNQLIVTTHDPQLVDPSSPGCIRRFWWIKGQGTKVYGMAEPTSESEGQQLRIALRQLGNRDVVFSRAGLLVEDESLQQFLVGVAPVLGYDLNAHGVSVIPVGGKDRFRPFFMLLNAFHIPYVALKDLAWGDPVRYPPDLFFDLGVELEPYLDANHLGGKRQAVVQQEGNNKVRVAGALALQLSKNEVPEIFNRVFSAAIQQATGEPSRL